MKNKPEIYISMDIETDGRIPGEYSMLSLGAVALLADGTELSSWYGNFELLPGARQDPDTMKFWAENQPYYDATRNDLMTPEEGMQSFRFWLLSQPGKTVAVAHPAGFDFTWVYWYLVKFTEGSPLSFSCIDMKTMVMMLTGQDYSHSTKRNWPRSWFHPTLKHSHHALEDAREQGYSFIQMLRQARQLKSKP